MKRAIIVGVSAFVLVLNACATTQDSQSQADLGDTDKAVQDEECNRTSWACGQGCGSENLARVDLYCKSFGGSEPDRWICEPC